MILLICSLLYVHRLEVECGIIGERSDFQRQFLTLFTKINSLRIVIQINVLNSIPLFGVQLCAYMNSAIKGYLCPNATFKFSNCQLF